MGKALFHLVLIVALTVLSQVGGLAWLLALATRRRVLAFVVIYASLSAGSPCRRYGLIWSWIGTAQPLWCACWQGTRV